MHRSTLILTMTCLTLASSFSQTPPPGAIVIKPGGKGAVPVTEAERFPDRPGYLVIRPRKPGAATPLANKLVGDLPGTKKPADTSSSELNSGDPKADGKLVLEVWDAAYIDGMKVGYYRTAIREFERNGQTLLYAIKEQRLTVARFQERVSLWSEDTTTEKPDGTVLVTCMRQGIGKDQRLAITGTVAGNTLKVNVEGEGGGSRTVPWPEGVIGIAQEARLLSDRKPKPGDTVEYRYYEGRLNFAVKFVLSIKPEEKVDLPGKAAPRSLLRVEQSMEPVKLADGSEFRLPGATVWVDPKTYEPVKMESEMPQLGGRLTVYRTNREDALRPPTRVPDLADVQSIVLDRRIPNIHALGEVTYRFSLSGEADPKRAFALDDRQSLHNLDAEKKTFELKVSRGARAAELLAPGVGVGPEYLDKSFFIDWDDPRVKRHAAQAVIGLPEAATTLQRAQAIERWVRQNMMNAEFSQAMASCANVARTLSGDCTEFSMLAVGMCRSLGIPARTTLGLIYAEVNGKPVLAYHMWFEIYTDGRWIGLDATLGRGGIGPGHLKITDASWHEERSLAPLLPVLNLLGSRPKVEIVRVLAP